MFIFRFFLHEATRGLREWYRNTFDPMGIKAAFYGRDLTEKQWLNRALYRVEQVHQKNTRYRRSRREALNQKHPNTPVIIFYD